MWRLGGWFDPSERRALASRRTAFALGPSVLLACPPSAITLAACLSTPAVQGCGTAWVRTHSNGLIVVPGLALAPLAALHALDSAVRCIDNAPVLTGAVAGLLAAGIGASLYAL